MKTNDDVNKDERKSWFDRPVSVERARKAAQRVIDAAFGNEDREKPHFTIPTNKDDDDVVLMDFITQSAAARLEGEKAAEERAWRSVQDEPPPDYETVLAQHVDDLYPVTAYRMADTWFYEQDGPEDVIEDGDHRHRPLKRAPTHWRPIPAGPALVRSNPTAEEGK